MPASPTSLAVQSVTPTPLTRPEPAISGVQQTRERQSLPPTGQALPQTETEDSAAKLSNMVEAINNHIQNLRRELEFTVDEDAKRVIITVRDAETGEMVRQIPPEDVYDIAENLSESVGLIFRAQV